MLLTVDEGRLSGEKAYAHDVAVVSRSPAARTKTFMVAQFVIL